MDNIYKNIEEYSANKKRKTSIAFDDMIDDMHINKKLNSIVTELFLLFLLRNHILKYQNMLD